MKRRTAPECIAYLFSCDWNDVKENRYQGYTNPSVYVIGDDYYCAPTVNQKLPEDFYDWEVCGEAYGRKIYKSELRQICP